jgi:hypothetical protein
MLSRGAASKAIAPERPWAATSAHSFPREAIVRPAGPGRSLLPKGSAAAIGEAIARRNPPASSCMTTAEPGRTSSPQRPAERLLAWQTTHHVLSVAAAWGVMVLAWQRGYGSHALWGIPATGVITEWVPLMMFAFRLALARQWTTTPRPVAVGVGGLL